METLEFYLVRNRDGKYLRSRGYHGYGECWVDELKYAKVYTRKGTALSQITYWASTFPDYGVPDLIPLTATPGEPINQVERVSASQKKKELREFKLKVMNTQRKIENLKKEIRDNGGRSPYLDALSELNQKILDYELNIQELSKK